MVKRHPPLDLQYPLYPVFVFCLAFILLLLTLSPYIKQNRLVLPSASSVPTAVPQPTNSPLLLTYTDDINQIQINYPQNWAINPSSLSPQQINFSSPDGGGLNIIITKTSSQSVSDYLTKTDVINQTAFEGRPVKEIVSSQPLTVAGFQAIQRQEKFSDAGFNAVVTYLFYQNKIYQIEALPGIDQIDVSADQKLLYDQILSGLRFL